ncbi:regulatory-associated protein of mtor [Anaeramoeba flamelloides]|uniref:Regulatory-associated protein of mtor n=1 Tax=Anaeramoeba flamelloides TaxID=1746091 RepID=A0AAV7YX56_9EUKA|nr:regulatory-associated protein of mtor [Anaeramoeba flamelloides]
MSSPLNKQKKRIEEKEKKKLNKNAYFTNSYFDTLAFFPDVHFKQREWKILSKTRTKIGIICACLNLGIDPPDVIKPDPCSILEGWVDPTKHDKQTSLALIGKNLQSQFMRCQPHSKYKQCLDPHIKKLKTICKCSRKYSLNERVFFYYNGHGVPMPTKNNEIWVFDEGYTQYIPLTLRELKSWLGSPAIYVFECSSAGRLSRAFTKHRQKQKQKPKPKINSNQLHLPQNSSAEESNEDQSNPNKGNKTPNKKKKKKESKGVLIMSTPTKISTTSPKLNTLETVAFFSCSANETLPTDPKMPADLFTSCLTTPIKAAFRWHIYTKFSSNTLIRALNYDLIDHIPGKINDRRTLLGELHWVYITIADTIAWNTLSTSLFQKLYRQDLMIATLFRNFLLAERIMKSYNCTPFTIPSIPETYKHDLWNSWDCLLDSCLSKMRNGYKSKFRTSNFSNLIDKETLLKVEQRKQKQEKKEKKKKKQLEKKKNKKKKQRGKGKKGKDKKGNLENKKTNSTFYDDQLTSFEIWINSGRNRKTGIGKLPILLQVILTQQYQHRVLVLLARFVDLGSWAIEKALCVGVFPYLLRLLKSPISEIRTILLFIWAKILIYDPSCQINLVAEKSYQYFLKVLATNNLDNVLYSLSSLILSLIQNNYPKGKISCHRYGILEFCLYRIHNQSQNVRKWSTLCLAKYWQNFNRGKRQCVLTKAYNQILLLLNDQIPEIRAASIYALSTFLGTIDQSVENNDKIFLDLMIGLNVIYKMKNEACPLVRHECLLFIIKLLILFENEFKKIIKILQNCKLNSNNALETFLNQTNSNYELIIELLNQESQIELNFINNIKKINKINNNQKNNKQNNNNNNNGNNNNDNNNNNNNDDDDDDNINNNENNNINNNDNNKNDGNIKNKKKNEIFKEYQKNINFKNYFANPKFLAINCIWNMFIKFCNDPYPLIKNLSLEVAKHFLIFWEENRSPIDNNQFSKYFNTIFDRNFKLSLLKIKERHSINEMIYNSPWRSRKNSLSKKKKIIEKKKLLQKKNNKNNNFLKNIEQRKKNEKLVLKKSKKGDNLISSVLNENHVSTKKKSNRVYHSLANFSNNLKNNTINNFHNDGNSQQKHNNKNVLLVDILKIDQSKFYYWCISQIMKPLIFIKEDREVNVSSNSISKSKSKSKAKAKTVTMESTASSMSTASISSPKLSTTFSLESNESNLNQIKYSFEGSLKLNENYLTSQTFSNIPSIINLLMNRNNFNSNKNSSMNFNDNMRGGNSKRDGEGGNSQSNTDFKNRMGINTSNSFSKASSDYYLHKWRKKIIKKTQKTAIKYSQNIDLEKIQLNDQVSFIPSIEENFNNFVFDSYESYIYCINNNNKLALCNWEQNSGEIVSKYQNIDSKKSKITSLQLINENTEPLLMTGDDSGIIKIFKSDQIKLNNLNYQKNSSRAICKLNTIGIPIRRTFTLQSRLIKNNKNLKNNNSISNYDSNYNSFADNSINSIISSSKIQSDLKKKISYCHLITAWNALPECQKIHKNDNNNKKKKMNQCEINKSVGMKFCWNQNIGKLAVGGDSKFVKIWDIETQTQISKFSFQNQQQINSIHNLLWFDTNTMFFGGDEGTLIQIDLREGQHFNNNNNNMNINMDTRISPVYSSNEHEDPIISLNTTLFDKNVLISVSSNGLLIFRDLRKINNYRSFLVGNSNSNIISFDQHQYSKMFAVATKKDGIIVYDWNCKIISNFKNYNRFSNSKFGRINKIKFHPYKLLLGVAADSNFSLFGPAFKK